MDLATQNWSRGDLKNVIFSCGPLSGAVEALLTKVVNQRLSVSPIVVFFVAPYRANVSMLLA